jgi:signal transduction histidine kinase
MARTILENLKNYVHFEEADARRLVEAGPHVAAVFGRAVDRFYDEIFKNAETAAVLTEDRAVVERLKQSLLDWLRDLFSGRYDDAYYDKRSRIGHTHVRIRLPQHFIFGAIEVVALELRTAIRGSPLAEPERTVDSLQKLLAIETAIMMETYKESYSAQIRRVERDTYEEKLTRAEHLAHVGELAASLAHEIKNPLAGISGAIQVFDQQLAPDHPHKEILAEILSQIDRLDRTMRDLLIYARPKPPKRRSVDVGTLFERTLVLLRGAAVFRGVQITTRGLDAGIAARVDEGQIQQVMANLLLNAAQACKPRGGAIECAVSATDSATRIEVIDTGAGMSAESLKRAFEPFFTTRTRGTGLGLSICRRVVEAHGGMILIESRLGSGTRVAIELPTNG